MATATKEQINDIFLSDSGFSIPLLEERVEVINESGRIAKEAGKTFISLYLSTFRNLVVLFLTVLLLPTVVPKSC